MKKHKNKIIAGVIIAIVLAFVFWYGGDAPSLRGWSPESKETVCVVKNEKSTKKENAEKPQSSANIKKQVKTERNNIEYSKQNGMIINENTGKDKYKTEPVPKGKPVPAEPENTPVTNRELTCILSVRCDTIMDNIEWLDIQKANVIPKDGVIFPEKTVTFYEGESVFNLLVREMKRNKIHMEFVNVPVYNSAYIEGIANLYEFDCGELSGWMYKVNAWFPNYGCSRYLLKDGDKVEWVYTCDLGVDVGGNYSARNGN